MAKVDEEGERFPPWANFRFNTFDLESWFDGKKRILVRGEDFPSDAPFPNLKRRLEMSAHKRRGRARIWRIDDDHVGMILTPPWTL